MTISPDWVCVRFRIFSPPLRGVALGCLLLFGCTPQEPSKPLYTPGHVIPMTQAPTAPSDTTPTAATPAQTGPRDGYYRGTSSVMFSGGGRCMGTQQVSGFRVHGDRVDFNGFHGRIDANNGVQMHHGLDWLVGQFEGSVFVGQLEIGKWSSKPSCVYMLRLERHAAGQQS